MKIQLKYPSSNVMKNCKVGFSWTMFFFGLFVPIVRGDLKWTFFSLVLMFITFGLFWFILPFFYNKVYIKDLLEKGYVPSSEHSKNILIQKGWIVK